MQRGSYDITQPSEANATKEEDEGGPLLEMEEKSTCILKEIIEGDESEKKEAAEGGGGDVGEGSQAVGHPEAPSEGSEESDDEEEVKANGGEELAKAEEVKVDIGPPAQGSGARRKTLWQRFTFSNKCLICIVIILALCIFFMAIAWPKEQKRGEATTAGSQAGAQKGTSVVPVPTTASTSTTASSLPASTAIPTSNTRQTTPAVTVGNVDADGTSEVSPTTEGPTEGEKSTMEDFNGGDYRAETEGSASGENEGSATEPREIENINSTGGQNKNKNMLDKLTQASSQTENNRPVCQSSTCKSLAANMLAFMNPDSTNPCEEFYTYACGGMTAEGHGWISETVSDSEAWSRISDGMKLVNEKSSRGIRLFKNFYESCVAYEVNVSMETRIEKARDILTKIGQFYKKEDWVGDYGPENFTQLLGNFLSRHYSPFMDLLLDVDSGNSSKFALKLTLPLHQSPFGDMTGSDSQAALSGLPNEACKRKAAAKPKKEETSPLAQRYKDYVKCSDDFQVPAYVKEVKTALKALRISMDENEWKMFFPDIVDILKTMTGILPTNGDKRKIIAAKNFKKYTLEELQQNENFTYVEWQDLTNRLTKSIVPKDTEVQVYFESYFKTLFEEFSKWETRQWNNVLMAMFAHELYYGLVAHTICTREDYCLGVAGRLMGDAASALFLKSYSPEELSAYQKKITSTFSDIMNSLHSEISQSNTEDAESSSKDMKTKLQGISLIADGGVPIFQNDDYLNRQYQAYNEKVTYLENAISLLEGYRMKMYQSYNKNPSDEEQIWFHFLDPYSNKGLALVELNKIVVPYGIMQRPFFSDFYPSYIQMARLGQEIAKEIWHILSEKGIQQQLMPSMINKGLLQSMPSFSDSSFHDNDNIALFFGTSPALREVANIEKNITAIYKSDMLADGVAVYLAYNSIWRNNTGENDKKLPWIELSPKQLYFLAIAQTLCTKSSAYDYTLSIFEDLQLPPFIRVNDIARNSRQFAEAFHCPARSRNDDTPTLT